MYHVKCKGYVSKKILCWFFIRKMWNVKFNYFSMSFYSLRLLLSKNFLCVDIKKSYKDNFALCDKFYYFSKRQWLSHNYYSQTQIIKFFSWNLYEEWNWNKKLPRDLLFLNDILLSVHFQLIPYDPLIILSNFSLNTTIDGIILHKFYFALYWIYSSLWLW